MSEHLLSLFPTLFRPSTHLAVDEAIARFTGRSHDIINIPGKPTPEGYKMWVLACDGFVLAWLFHTKRKYYGPIDLETKWLRDPYKLSKTEAVVATLLHRFQENGNFQYIVWLDNLFTSARLLVILRDTLGYGAAGTVRSATAKGDDNARGFDNSLYDLKKRFGDSIKWGHTTLRSQKATSYSSHGRTRH